MTFISPDILQDTASASAPESSASYPLHEAANKGHTRVARLLIERGHDPLRLDDSGLRASERARAAGYVDLASELAALEGEKGTSAQRLSVKELFGLVQGKTATITALIEARRVRAIDAKGDTPLHICAAQGRLHYCDLLVKAGADPSVRNFDGKAPHERAAENGHVTAAELLRALVPEPTSAEPNLLRPKEEPEGRLSSPPQPEPEMDEVFEFDEFDLDFEGSQEAEDFHEQLDLVSHVSNFAKVEGRVVRLGHEDGAELALDDLWHDGLRIDSETPATPFRRLWKTADEATFRSYLDVRNWPGPVRSDRAPTTRYHEIEQEILEDWVAGVLAKGTCAQDDICELIGSVKGSFEEAILRGNITRELTILGLMSSDQAEPFDGDLPDADDLADLLVSICNGSNMRPGLEFISVSAEREAQLFDVMASCEEDICRALVSKNLLVSVVIMLGERLDSGAIDPDLLCELDLKKTRQTADADALSAALSYLVGYQTLLEDDEATAEDEAKAMEAVKAMRLSRTAIELIAQGLEANPALDAPRRQIVQSATRRAAAVEEITTLHLPMVRRQAARHGAPGDLEDHFQDGVFGLMRAIEKFDRDTGYRLMTYAQFHIRSRMTKEFLDTGRLIRLPVHAGDALRRAEAALEYLPLDASVESREIAIREKTELSLDQYEFLKRYAQTFEEVDEFTPDFARACHEPFAEVQEQQTRIVVRSALDRLGARKRDILEMRFGFGDYEEHTLEECGVKYGVTRERIRQIEAKALKQLRHPAHFRRLRGLL